MMNEKMQWFQDARFGMFIHFGLYAIPGRGEWVRSVEKLTIEDYQPYFEEFDPYLADPLAWAQAAKDAGMKYIVLTAKHHDGFCLYDSQLTEYKITNTPFGRDLIAEYVEAVRQVGLKVGLYFSLIDWYHKDYPKYNDRHHPMRGNDIYKDEKVDFDSYLDFMHGQVKEIVTRYGHLDILWFDFSYDDMRADKWRAEELMAMVREYQPNVIIDNRLETSGEGYGSIIEANPTSYSGDFVSPEHILPAYGIRNRVGQLIPWELCTTINDHWGYVATDQRYKSPAFIIRKLVECVSKNGNLLLNVAPTGLGHFPQPSLDILAQVGNWMRIYGQSIYGCGWVDLPKPEWGYYTAKKGIIYAHVFETPLGVLHLPGLSAEQIKSIRRLSDGTEVKISDSWTRLAFTDLTFVELGDQHFMPNLEDDWDTVLKITLKEDLPCMR